MPSYDVFISYVRRGVSGDFSNELYERRLRGTLNPRGSPRVFMDKDMEGGQAFYRD